MTLSVTINDETPAVRLAVNGDTLAEQLVRALHCVSRANRVTELDVQALFGILYDVRPDVLSVTNRIATLEYLGLIERYTYSTWRLTRMGKRAIAMLAAAA